MTEKQLPGDSSPIRSSRVVNPAWTIALGLTMTVGLGIFTLLGEFMQEGARNLIGGYLLATVVAVPFVATYAERALAMPGRQGIYAFARAGNLLWTRYFIGWLTLGGYAALVALLGYGIALYSALLLRTALGVESASINLLAVVVMVGAGVYTLFRSGIGWNRRVTLILISAAFLLIALLFSLSTPSTATAGEPALLLRGSVLHVAGLVSVTYWSVILVVDVRARIRRPVQTLIPSLSAALLIGMGLGVLAGGSLVRHHGQLPIPAVPLYGLVAPSGGFSLSLALLIFFGVVVNLFGIVQVLVAGAQLLGNMAEDGFFPLPADLIVHERLPTGMAVLMGSVTGALLLIVIPVPLLAALAAFFFFAVSVLVYAPDVGRAAPALSPQRRVKLPFHPLIPGLVVVISVLTIVLLLRAALVYGAVWIAIGALLYLLHGRSHAMRTQRDQLVLAEADDGHADEARMRIMVCVQESQNADELIRFGSMLAEAYASELLVLRIVVSKHALALSADHAAADEQYRFLDALLARSPDAAVRPRPIVRLAPSLVDGILVSIREEACDMVVLASQGRYGKNRKANDEILDQVMSYAESHVVVLHGAPETRAQSILVATAGGPHTAYGFELARTLAGANPARIDVITVADNAAADPNEQALEALHRCLGDSFVRQRVAGLEAEDDVDNEEGETVCGAETEKRHGDSVATESGHEAALDNRDSGADPDDTGADQAAVHARVLHAASTAAGVIEAAEEADLLIVGASPATVLDRPVYAGFARDLATESACPTIIVRRDRQRRYPGLDRLTDRFLAALPTLSATRRSEVVVNMRQAAEPSIDFFVLILLSATIASFGLLQNSAAVIIGAMLVAPLMSPILAIAMGMVVAEFDIVTSAVEATIKGVVLAVLVGMVAVLVSPITGATTEIVARTEPNILDLMVALASGAAAGYALSRKEVAAALPGVAIAAALVPPLCVIGYSIGVANLGDAAGASLLFATNLVAIIFAAALTFLVLGFHPPRTERDDLARSLWLTVAGLLIIVIMLGVATYISVAESNRRAAVQAVFDDYSAQHRAVVSDFDISGASQGYVIRVTLMHYDDRRTHGDGLDELLASLERAVGGEVQLDATVVDAEMLGVAPDSREREILLAAEDAIAATGGTVRDSWADMTPDQVVVRAVVYVPDDHGLDPATISAINQRLSDTFARPVVLSLTVLSAHTMGATPTPFPTRPSSP